jgi:outer membrane protease
MNRFLLLCFVFHLLTYRIAAQPDAADNIPPVEETPPTAAEDETPPEDVDDPATVEQPAPPPKKRGFPYRMSLKTSAGFLYGQSEEIVYWWDAQNGHSDDKLSQLLWDMKTLYYISTELAFEPEQPFQKRGVFSCVKTSFGIPGPTGNMEDRDWDDETARKNLTIFSKHDNVTTGMFILNAGFGFSFPIKRALIKPFVSFDLMHFSWSGNDGHGTYRGNPMAYFGPVITYSQTWYIVSPGVSLVFQLTPFIELGALLKITPLIWCFDEDNHHLRQIQFIDEMRWGLLAEPGAEVVFTPHDRLSLFLSAAFKEINDTRGITKRSAITGGLAESTDSQNANIVNGSGAGYHVFDIALGLKVRLF